MIVTSRLALLPRGTAACRLDEKVFAKVSGDAVIILGGGGRQFCGLGDGAPITVPDRVP
jgi:hypothetical protein